MSRIRTVVPAADESSALEPGVAAALDAMGISVVIPTYGRDAVLVNSIAALIPQLPVNGELIIVDQSPQHDPESHSKLEYWNAEGLIRWIRLGEPSVTRAMNRGLLAARHSVVLFLDDDIEPAQELIQRHLAFHRRWPGDLAAGRVIQPWQVDQPPDPESLFNSPDEGARTEFMGGNFSVKRGSALAAGGFDENFRYAAYRYEREFADRLLRLGGRIHYIPGACIHHLQATRGGVRSFGSHLKTASPGHSQGAYYYLLGSGGGRFSRILGRLLRAPATRFHLQKPWYIPITLVGELRGLVLATRLHLLGPKLLTPPDIVAEAMRQGKP